MLKKIICLLFSIALSQWAQATQIMGQAIVVDGRLECLSCPRDTVTGIPEDELANYIVYPGSDTEWPVIQQYLGGIISRVAVLYWDVPDTWTPPAMSNRKVYPFHDIMVGYLNGWIDELPDFSQFYFNPYGLKSSIVIRREVSEVPLPGSALLFGTALLGIVAIRRRGASG